MSSVLPFREEEPGEPAEVAELERATREARQGFGKPSTAPNKLSVSHTKLTRKVWVQQEIERLLTGREFEILPSKGRGEASIVLHPKAGEGDAVVVNGGLRTDAIPWMPGTVFHGYALWTSNGKMTCPTFDILSGPPQIGGTCAGAAAAQSIVQPELREKTRKRIPTHLPGSNALARAEYDLTTAVCQHCYAGQGQYVTVQPLTGEIVKAWWLRTMLEQSGGRDYERLARTIIEALVTSNHFSEKARHPWTNTMPVRIHSAGDFFSPRYFELWCDIARRLYLLDRSIVLWAPTRAWALEGFIDWSYLRRQPNFVVRASGYQINGRAPGRLVEDNAEGTSVVIQNENLGMRADLEKRAEAKSRGIYEANRARLGGPAHDERFDWDCQVYAIDSKGHACVNATGPNGKPNCRACWVNRELSINFSLH